MTKPLPGIEHVVVLMLENRSFDNVFGGLYPKETRQGLFRGLWGNETNPRDPANPRAGSVTVFQGPAASPTWVMPYPDPGELYCDMVQQLFGSKSELPCSVPPPMSGFAWNYTNQPAAPPGPHYPAVSPVAEHIMQYYSADSLPVSHGLAKSFAVCDCWFAAAPVQTIANRVLAHCGTPSKKSSTESRVNNPDYTPDLHKFPPEPPVTDKTIFELLDEKWPHRKAATYCWEPPTPHLNWKVYYHDAPLSALCKYVYRHWCYDSLYGGNVFNFNRFDGGTNFEHDIENHVLPAYSFIEPRYTNFFHGTVNSNHPGGAGIDCSDPNGGSLPPPVSVEDGEALLCEIYQILRRHPKTFAKTLLIVTYDEHGGLYDHVPPPCAVSPFSSAVTNFDYDRYGVRVPALLINPMIKPGTIYPARAPYAKLPDPPFDHTSILSTLIAQFDLSGTLTPRVASAPPLADLLTGTTYDPPDICTPRQAAQTRVAPPLVRRRPCGIPTGAVSLAGVLCWLYNHFPLAEEEPTGP